MFLRSLSGAVVSAAVLAGCLTPQTILSTRYYRITPEAIESGTVLSSATIGLRPLIAAKPYKSEIAYRGEPHRLAYFPRAEWAELPGAMVSRAIFDSVVQRSLFADAGDAANMARPDYMLTGELRRFEADYTGDSPRFVVTAMLSIRATSDGANLWQQVIDVDVPLASAQALGVSDSEMADIAQAASEAVTQLSAAICTQLAETLSK